MGIFSKLFGKKKKRELPIDQSKLEVKVIDYRSDEERRIEKEAMAGVSLGPEVDALVNELIEIDCTDGFLSMMPSGKFDENKRHKRAREIGERLNALGGMKLIKKYGIESGSKVSWESLAIYYLHGSIYRRMKDCGYHSVLALISSNQVGIPGQRNQLIEDIARYEENPNCNLSCFVSDPERWTFLTSPIMRAERHQSIDEVFSTTGETFQADSFIFFIRRVCSSFALETGGFFLSYAPSPIPCTLFDHQI